MTDANPLQAQRQANWGQTPETRTPDPDAAIRLIERVGVATLFPASPELPNLFHAYVGDPAAQTESAWDSPAGHVYGWRWDLGRREAAFYTAVVRKRPTWVAWTLLPALLRWRGELRPPPALYDAGELSADAHRVAQALAAAGGVLSTGDLREAAGFPTGKANRAAYLRAVQELDERLLLAKVFSGDDLDMRHALVRSRYPEAVAEAERLTEEAAVDRFLAAYLPPAAYAAPVPLARHLGVARPTLEAGLKRLVERGKAVTASLPTDRKPCYRWTG